MLQRKTKKEEMKNDGGLLTFEQHDAACTSALDN